MNIKYNGVINLGFNTEVGGVIEFPAEKWISTYGTTNYTLKHERPDGTILTHALTVGETTLTWEITPDDRFYPGIGKAQIIYANNDNTIIAKSQIMTTKIKEWR